MDPCAPRGASYTVDGFDTGFAALCNLGPAPSANPEPEPPATTCHITTLTKGPRRGQYEDWTFDRYRPLLPRDQRHGGFISADGVWSFFFEAMATFQGGPVNHEDWEWSQTTITEGDYILKFTDGSEAPVHLHLPNPNDMAEVPLQSWVGDIFYWRDNPGIGMHTRDNSGVVVQGHIVYFMTFEAKNKTTGESCNTTLTLELNIDRTDGPGPPYPAGHGHWN
jgi:hypothetical protein